MFMPNDVYSWDQRRIRILWSNRQAVFWIDIDDEGALPQIASKSDLEHLLARADLKAITDPYLNVSMTPSKSGSKAEAVQEKAWAAIKDAVKAEPEIYQRKTRGELLNRVLGETGTTKQTVYRWLRRYWQFGMCKNALNGRYDLCGGVGKPKSFESKRNGRMRTRSPGEGVPITDGIKSLFRIVIEKCLLNEGKYEFDYAYNQLLISYGVKIPSTPEDLINVPTERQFKYFYQKEYTSIEVTKKREGEINYLKDFSPSLGTSTAEVPGPGYLYQIDATIADVYLTSEHDRAEIIGRPTMYFVVDVFSRAIVGMYVGLENASWVSAMEALGNAMADKVAYCAEYGVEITSDLWPMEGLPENIIGDRGEMLGRHVEVLSKSFHVDIQNTPAFRADWKGIVERYFRTIQTKMKPFVEGYVTKDPIGKKRHGNDYRQDGMLTLKEFTKMIIKIVLHYNNDHVVSTYDIDSDVPKSLPANPLILWNWGIEYRTGLLRRPDPQLVKINLLPHTNATVTEYGLKLFGCYYSCKQALDWGWFEENYRGPKTVTVAYDLYSTNVIYLRPSDSYLEFIPANLTARSRAYADITVWELWIAQDMRRDVAATSKLKQRSGSVNLVSDLQQIKDESKQQQPTYSKAEKAKRVKGINDNKRNERQYERSKKTADRKAPVDNHTATVTPIHGGTSGQKGFKLPTRLKDLLKEDDADE
ncbi:Tn7-like transposition protein B [Hahella chejuensis KCTC 2396]|uniref:Tn7-like transposition protein B n=1 Tax=Hahella chejuensis (strain KCTC 2396) TaxID=349521 RepID=Q2S6P6_HAHCH|nr:Mu transposase C-terminal domain-containing protein [Hahella chejuensis]ABC33678.1 Tn7-like transposition protein B [Hahella chejuensis KCTC 2396]